MERAAKIGDSRLQYQLLKEICGPIWRRPISLPILGTNWVTKTAKETAQAFRQHFERVFNRHRHVNLDFVNDKLEQQPMIEALDQPITREEVVEAVKSLQNLKAPGKDGVPSEV